MSITTQFNRRKPFKIKKAHTEIDTLTEEKYKLEAEYRALEVEVGPIKYIAESHMAKKQTGIY